MRGEREFRGEGHARTNGIGDYPPRFLHGGHVCSGISVKGQFVFAPRQVKVSLRESLSHGIGAILRYSLQTEENYEESWKSYTKHGSLLLDTRVLAKTIPPRSL